MGQSGAGAICVWMKSAKGSPPRRRRGNEAGISRQRGRSNRQALQLNQWSTEARLRLAALEGK